MPGTGNFSVVCSPIASKHYRPIKTARLWALVPATCLVGRGLSSLGGNGCPRDYKRTNLLKFA